MFHPGVVHGAQGQVSLFSTSPPASPLPMPCALCRNCPLPLLPEQVWGHNLCCSLQ